MTSGRPAPFSIVPFRACSYPGCRRTSDTVGSGWRWLTCTACRVERYCTVKCGRADWSRHEPRCDIMRTSGTESMDRVALRNSIALRDACVMVDRLLSFSNWFQDFLTATAWVGWSIWGPGILTVDLTRGGGVTLPKMAAWLQLHPRTREGSVCTANMFAGNLGYVPTRDVPDVFGSYLSICKSALCYNSATEAMCCFIVELGTVINGKRYRDTVHTVPRLAGPRGGGTIRRLMRRLGPDATVVAPALDPAAKRTTADILEAGPTRRNLLRQAAWLTTTQRILAGAPLMLTTGDQSDRRSMALRFRDPGLTVTLEAPRGHGPCASIQMSVTGNSSK